MALFIKNTVWVRILLRRGPAFTRLMAFPLLQLRIALKIYPGFGALTKPLAERAKQVVSSEIDRTLIPILECNAGKIRQRSRNLRRCDADETRARGGSIRRGLSVAAHRRQFAVLHHDRRADQTDARAAACQIHRGDDSKRSATSLLSARATTDAVRWPVMCANIAIM